MRCPGAALARFDESERHAGGDRQVPADGRLQQPLRVGRCRPVEARLWRQPERVGCGNLKVPRRYRRMPNGADRLLEVADRPCPVGAGILALRKASASVAGLPW